MDEKDKMYLDELQRIYERAYRRGFYDALNFLLDVSKDPGIIKVFKDGNIFR